MLKTRLLPFFSELLRHGLTRSEYGFLESQILLFKVRCQSKNLNTLRPIRIEKNFETRRNSFRLLHSNLTMMKKKDDMQKIVKRFIDFEEAETKDKRTFLEKIRLYESNFPTRKNNVDFIKTALSCMKEFGVHKDLEVYKKLLDTLPKGVLVCTNRMQADLMYYPRHQFVAIELLETMESNGVLPDVEMGNMYINIFGRMAHPTKRFKESFYWLHKFKNKSPWPLPRSVPSDPYLLAKMAIERITSVDIETEITTFQTEKVAESLDKTWIVSGQSPKQRELLKKHPPKVPVLVEGGDLVYLRDQRVSYFILKADHEPYPYIEEDTNDFSKIESMYFNPKYVEKEDGTRTVHEQDDGIIYASCATGTSSKDSLLSWVRLLQKNGNSALEYLPILFRFKTEESKLVPYSSELVIKET